VNFEQIMSKDKYPSIFSKSNGSYCVYYPSNIFCNMCSFENKLGNILGNIQSCEAFRPITPERKSLMDYNQK